MLQPIEKLLDILVTNAAVKLQDKMWLAEIFGEGMAALTHTGSLRKSVSRDHAR